MEKTKNEHTLTVVKAAKPATNRRAQNKARRSKQPAPIIDRDPAIMWQGRVQFMVPANAEATDMGGPCLVVPMGSRLEMHVTNDVIFPDLMEPTDRMVQGLLTIRRGSPGHVASMTLALDDERPPAFELRVAPNGKRAGVFSIKIPGGLLYIERAFRNENARLAA